MSIPKLKNPPVQNGNKEDESPGGEVDKNACRRPDGKAQLHTTRRRRRGVKVFKVVPEKFGPDRDTRTKPVSERREIVRGAHTETDDQPKFFLLAHTSQEGQTGTPLQGKDDPTEDAEEDGGRMDERPDSLPPTKSMACHCPADKEISLGGDGDGDQVVPGDESHPEEQRHGAELVGP